MRAFASWVASFASSSFARCSASSSSASLSRSLQPRDGVVGRRELGRRVLVRFGRLGEVRLQQVHPGVGLLQRVPSGLVALLRLVQLFPQGVGSRRGLAQLGQAQTGVGHEALRPDRVREQRLLPVLGFGELSANGVEL